VGVFLDFEVYRRSKASSILLLPITSRMAASEALLMVLAGSTTVKRKSMGSFDLVLDDKPNIYDIFVAGSASGIHR